MSVIATALKHMLAAGMDHEAIVAAVAEMEATRPADPQAERRREKDRERKRLRNSAESAESADPPRSPSFSPQTPQNHPHTPPSNNTRTRGSRLAEGWRPQPFVVEAGGLGLGEEDLRGELDKFRDYWRSVPGAKGLKLDWDATWRNWLRKASENTPRKAHHDRPHHDAKFDAKQANLARAWTGSERAARFRGEP